MWQYRYPNNSNDSCYVNKDVDNSPLNCLLEPRRLCSFLHWIWTTPNTRCCQIKHILSTRIGRKNNNTRQLKIPTLSLKLLSNVVGFSVKVGLVKKKKKLCIARSVNVNHYSRWIVFIQILARLPVRCRNSICLPFICLYAPVVYSFCSSARSCGKFKKSNNNKKIKMVFLKKKRFPQYVGQRKRAVVVGSESRTVVGKPRIILFN